ncbi:MAG: choice-of-anchor R domain-containing protein [Terriglobales bacterium]
MTSSSSRILFALALTICLTLPAMADSTAFTDLGPGGSYLCCSTFEIGGGPDAYEAVANEFTASVGGTLSQVDVGLTNQSGTNSAVVSLYSDVGGTLGSLLFSGTVMNQPQSGTTPTVLATLFPSSGSLVAGDNYFLVVAPGASDTLDGWNFNSTSASGTVLLGIGSGFGSGFTAALNAFDVKVNTATVPEPSAWLMLGAELICLLAIAAARRKLFA